MDVGGALAAGGLSAVSNGTAGGPPNGALISTMRLKMSGRTSAA